MSDIDGALNGARSILEKYATQADSGNTRDAIIASAEALDAAKPMLTDEMKSDETLASQAGMHVERMRQAFQESRFDLALGHASAILALVEPPRQAGFLEKIQHFGGRAKVNSLSGVPLSDSIVPNDKKPPWVA